MKYIDHSGKVDLSDWDLKVPELDLNVQFTDAIGIALKELMNEGRASFPVFFGAWGSPDDGLGGDAPKDPTTIYLDVPFGPRDCGPVWETSLTEMINSYLADADMFIKGAHSDDIKIGRKACVMLRDGLQKQIDTLNTAIAVIDKD